MGDQEGGILTESIQELPYQVIKMDNFLFF